MNLSAPCLKTYTASKKSGNRPLAAIKWVVIHDTEGGTAESIARYFSSPTAKGSAHIVVDEDRCYRVLGNEDIPWAAPGANYNGFHIEVCGWARWTNLVWKQHRQTLERAAYKTALHCRRFGIPPVYVGPRGLRNGKEGVTTHKAITKAWPQLGDHTDPGAGYPWIYFMSLVRKYYKEIVNV